MLILLLILSINMLHFTGPSSMRCVKYLYTVWGKKNMVAQPDLADLGRFTKQCCSHKSENLDKYQLHVGTLTCFLILSVHCSILHMCFKCTIIQSYYFLFSLLIFQWKTECLPIKNKKVILQLPLKNWWNCREG